VLAPGVLPRGNQSAKALYRDENLFEDADLQMAGYAAALRVLTRYSMIDGSFALPDAILVEISRIAQRSQVCIEAVPQDRLKDPQTRCHATTLRRLG
jgi:hypothetical protein